MSPNFLLGRAEAIIDNLKGDTDKDPAPNSLLWVIQKMVTLLRTQEEEKLNIPDRFRGYATTQETIDAMHDAYKKELSVVKTLMKHRIEVTKREDDEGYEVVNKHLDYFADSFMRMLFDITGLYPRIVDRIKKNEGDFGIKGTDHDAVTRLLDRMLGDEDKSDAENWNILEQYLKDIKKHRNPELVKTKLFNVDKANKDSDTVLQESYEQIIRLSKWMSANHNMLAQPPITPEVPAETLMDCVIRTIEYQNKRLTRDESLDADAAEKMGELRGWLEEHDRRQFMIATPRDVVDYVKHTIKHLEGKLSG